MMRETSIFSGPKVEKILYSCAAGREPANIRAEKRKLSSPAMARANAKLSWKQLERRLAANILPGDLVVTATFDDDHLPEDRKEAKARMKAFFDSMRKARRRRGKIFRCVYCIESRHGDGRWHFHFVINATGDDYREILSCWPYGSDIEIHRFEISKTRNYETLAKYMAKERPTTERQHVWGCTRNCAKPERESRIVRDDAELTVPDGAVWVVREIVQNEFGRWEYLSYILTDPEALRKARPKAKRRR